ncbi:hypothetical protein H4R24_003814, partial [Coemansia sp. RSA 988]
MPAFTVLSTKGRAVTVRPSPSDTLQSIVVSACSLLPNSGKPEDYTLLHNRKTLSLPTPVRLANLPQGAKLQLCLVNSKDAGNSTQNTEAPIKVALQIVGAGRIINDFATISTLWDILLKAESCSNGTLNLTTRCCQDQGKTTASIRDLLFGSINAIQPAKSDGVNSSPPLSTPVEGSVAYQQPVLLLLNKEFSTNDALQSTTLRSLGFTGGGNVMVRLSFKDAQINPSELRKMTDVRSCVSAQTPITSTKLHKIDANQSQPLESKILKPINALESATIPSHNERMIADKTDSTKQHVASSTLETQQIRVFDSPTASASPATRLASLDTSEVDSDDAKVLLSVQRTRQAESERGFKSRLAQEAEEKKRKDQFYQMHPKTVIRFRFPDQVQVQATFLSTDCVSKLFVFIADVLADAGVLSMLVLQPAQDLSVWKSKSLREAGLAPAAIVHVRLNGDSNSRPSTLELLTPDVGALAQPIEMSAETGGEMVANPPVERGSPASIASAQMPSLRNSPAPVENGRASSGPPTASGSGTKNRNALRMPKWFYA